LRFKGGWHPAVNLGLPRVETGVVCLVVGDLRRQEPDDWVLGGHVRAKQLGKTMPSGERPALSQEMDEFTSW
jgi:hypothetical protein